MRIISGTYRGKKLVPPADERVRPTTDRTKEAIFNIINSYIHDSCVFVDAFSGSGAIGIEALSRGVKKAYFIDNDPDSVKLIEKNLKGIRGSYEIIKKDFSSAFKYISSSGAQADIIYCDPPYRQDLGEKILKAVKESDLLSQTGKLLIERAKTIQPPVNEGFILTDTRSYALTAVDFFRRIKKVAVTGTFDPFTKGHSYLVQRAKEMFDKVHIVILRNEKKTSMLSEQTRKELAELATENAIVDTYEGFTVDYCNNNDIKYIIRGTRGPQDTAYELEMAEYNLKHGNIITLIIPSIDQISSTEVKRRLYEGLPIDGMVDEKIKEKLTN